MKKDVFQYLIINNFLKTIFDLVSNINFRFNHLFKKIHI